MNPGSLTFWTEITETDCLIYPNMSSVLTVQWCICFSQQNWWNPGGQVLIRRNRRGQSLVWDDIYEVAGLGLQPSVLSARPCCLLWFTRVTSRVSTSGALKRSSLAIIYPPTSFSLYLPAFLSIYSSIYLPASLSPSVWRASSHPWSLGNQKQASLPRLFLQPRAFHLSRASSLAPTRGLPEAHCHRTYQRRFKASAPRGRGRLPGEAGWGSRRPPPLPRVLTLPSVGAATRSTSRSGNSSAGGLGAVLGRMVGDRSEPRRGPGTRRLSGPLVPGAARFGSPAVKLAWPARPGRVL